MARFATVTRGQAVEAAWGICNIVTENIGERGHGSTSPKTPRSPDFTMVATGGPDRSMR